MIKDFSFPSMLTSAVLTCALVVTSILLSTSSTAVSRCSLSEELVHEYGFGLVDKIGNDYDAVVVAVSHKDYLKMDENYFKSICKPDGVIVDIKGFLRNKIHNLQYWSL